MDRQPLLRDLDAMDEARGDHPPADEALQAAQGENAGEPPAQAALDLAAREKPHERDREQHADQPPEQAMAPFPGIDGLEPGQVHVREQLAILRDFLVFRECGRPVRLAQRRQHAGDGLPFGDGEPQFGQARRAADDDHRENSGGDQPQPDADQRDRGRRALGRLAVEVRCGMSIRLAISGFVARRGQVAKKNRSGGRRCGLF